MFVILFGRNVYAEENNDGIIKILDDFAIYHNSEIALYNTEDECIGFYYEGVNDGYVIIDTYGEIIEFSYEDEIQVYENAENNCYYAGPGEYYMESENNENILVNITTNKNIEKIEVNSFKNITSNENIDKKLL
ncbi:hypothetical protein AALB81_13320 [Lachnospiraceae bacterium 48-33]